MATKSHGFGITLQYCLWDFLRELGEKKVGGEEMVKNLEEEAGGSGLASKVSKRRMENLAKLYAWCVAKEVLSLMILKVSFHSFSFPLPPFAAGLADPFLLARATPQPIPFGNPKPSTLTFLTLFFINLLLATQTTSPALLLPTTTTRKDKPAIERVFIKAAPHGPLLKGLGYFFETAMEEAEDRVDGERERKVVRFGVKVAKETLSSSSGIVVDLR
jgi:nucleolar MIF4G domain-containing protein 1